MLIYFQVKLLGTGKYVRFFFRSGLLFIPLYLFLQCFAYTLAIAIIILYCNSLLNKCVKLFVQSPQLDTELFQPRGSSSASCSSLYCGGGKVRYFSSPITRFLAEIPVTKDTLTRQMHKIYLTCFR